MQNYLKIFCIVLFCIVITGCSVDKSESVKNVEDLINSIGEITLENKEKINDAFEKYNRLTKKEQKQVSNYDLLKDLQAKYNELHKSEENIYQAYLGEYSISYDEQLFSSEHPFYVINKKISLLQKCYRVDESYPTDQDGDILKECLSFENAKTIPFVFSFDAFNIYESDSAIIFYTYFSNFTKSCIVPNATNENMREVSLRQSIICFTGNENELNQISCPSGLSMSDSWDDKYQFKLTKIK